MKRFCQILLFSIFFNSINAQCLEISSVFVNSCGAIEGANEMFTFTTSTSDIYVNDISVVWPNNSFLNFCQDAGTASTTAALNATILTTCGWLIEPLNDTIPAGSDVIVITSTNVSITDNSFEGLADTMYVIYQCAGNTAGHFANSGSGTRNLLVSVTGSCTSSELVSYDRASLIGGDGATVLYDAAGTATYVNNGCNAPVNSVSAAWTFANAGTFNNEICNDFGIIDLTTLLSTNATTGGTWSGPRVTGSNYDPTGYTGLDSVTYTISGTGSCTVLADSMIVFNVVAPSTENISTIACDSSYINGTWYYTDQTISYTNPSSYYYSCDSSFNIDLSISSVTQDSIYLESCNAVIYNGVSYTTDTIIRDTISTIGSVTSTCPELFISEYIEGQGLNRALEIYNGTGVTVDLSNYTLEIQRGNTTTPEIILPTGLLANGDVYVIHNDDASVDAAIVAVGDLASSDMIHNGDDSYTLKKNGVVVDIFGNVGCDPGQEWTDLGNGTKDNILYRQPNYTTGVLSTTTTPCDFPTLNATNWVSLDDDDDFSYLGAHTANCTIQNIAGCDSIYVLNINIIDSVFGQNPNNPLVICNSNDSVQLSDGSFAFAAGTYEIAAGLSASGCDSFVVNVVETQLCNTCTFETLLYEGFEYDTIIAAVDTSTIFGDGTPNGQLTGNSIFIGKQHTGTRFAYFNFKSPAGSVFYSNSIDVCANSDIRYSFWHRQYGTTLASNITVNVYDGPDNTYPLIYTQTFVSSSTTYQQVNSAVFTPTSNVFTFEMVDNVGGPVGGNDLLLDELLFESCSLDPVSYTQNYCTLSDPINLFDQIDGFVSQNGTWSGPSTLSNGYLGTYDPLSNLEGDYTYSITNACTDTSIIVTTNFTQSTPEIINLFDCNSIDYNNETFYNDTIFVDTVFSNNNQTCDSIYQVEIEIENLPAQFDLGEDTLICIGDSISLNATTASASYLWQDGSNSNVIMADEAGLYWVEVTTSNCSVRDSILINYDIPTITTSGDTTACYGEPITLSGDGTTTIIWDYTSATNNYEVTVTSDTSFTAYGVSSLNCVSDTVEIQVNVIQPINNIVFDITPSDTIFEGETVQISVEGNNIEAYSWSPIDENSNTLIDSPDSTTTYVVTLSNTPCPDIIDSITIHVVTIDGFNIITPNAFTPNGDGRNDVFRIVNFEDFETYDLKIYNRWGELIHEESAYGASWDGKYNGELQNNDTYVYYINATPKQGENKIISTGSFTVIR